MSGHARAREREDEARAAEAANRGAERYLAARYEAALRAIIEEAPPFRPESRVWDDSDDAKNQGYRVARWEAAVLAYEALGLPVPEAPTYAEGDRVHARPGAGLQPSAELCKLGLATGVVVEVDEGAEGGELEVSWGGFSPCTEYAEDVIHCRPGCPCGAIHDEE